MLEKPQENDWVWSTTHQARARVIERIELWDETSLRLWFPHDNSVHLVTPAEVSENQPEERAKEEPSSSPASVRFASVLGKLSGLLHEDKLLAPLDSAVTPLPHQIKVLQKVISKSSVRYLFADEVGLGKTIEAGLAIKELKMRGRAQRILVVAPKGLIPQWIVEMDEKFGEEFRFFDPSEFKAYRRISGDENVWSSFDQVICSMDAIKPLETRRGWSQEKINAYNQERLHSLSEANWDLVIIDEAHRVAGSADTVARHAMARTLADSTPHLLLLSATPHQGKTGAFHRLMSLLDNEAFPHESAVSKERVAPYVIRTEKRNALDHHGNALFKPRLTRLVPIPWDDSSIDQQELYDAVTEYVRIGYNQAKQQKNNSVGFLMILMQRLVTSSTCAIAATLERRLEALAQPPGQLELFSILELDELSQQDGQTQVDNLLSKTLSGLKNERKEVEVLLDAAKRVIAKCPDAKAKALLDMIMQLQREEADPELKVLIFTEFVPTQKMLEEYLTESGFSVVTLNGSLNMEERKEVQRKFSEDARIMIATDAGGEGLNLQFCHIIINFDLGWRPMAIEQRIGRVDRIGQKHVVKAINFVLEDSVEYRVRDVLEQKLAVIFDQFGIDKTSDVLDSEEGAHMFDKLFIEALLKPETLEKEVGEVTQMVEQEAKSSHDQVSVLSGTPPSDDILSEISSIPLGDYLEMLVESHLETIGGELTRSNSGLEARWPDDSSATLLTFAGKPSSAQAELLTLDHPKIRKIIAQAPNISSGDNIPVYTMPNMPGDVSGSWSLWQLRFPSHDRVIQQYFAVFVTDAGKSFDRTADTLWNQLIHSQLTTQTAISGSSATTLFDLHKKQAEQSGLRHYQTLKASHQEELVETENRGRFHFESRFSQLDDIGLPEVRNFRHRQLELEQSAWLEELSKKRRVCPELTPISIIQLIAD